MNTQGTWGQGHTGHHGPVGAAVLALLFLDLEYPCLCSASVTLERRSLESLLCLFLLCFGPAWSPGQAELVSVTLGRRISTTQRARASRENSMGGELQTASGRSMQRTRESEEDEPHCSAHPVTNV